jgi:hypothetical protein
MPKMTRAERSRINKANWAKTHGRSSGSSRSVANKRGELTPAARRFREMDEPIPDDSEEHAEYVRIASRQAQKAGAAKWYCVDDGMESMKCFATHPEAVKYIVRITPRASSGGTDADYRKWLFKEGLSVQHGDKRDIEYDGDEAHS